eukprot:CAMPEP_0116049304 /NCGR_PEP_ID=MMETSP0321-20121206/30094_1 /TAXON_ID=163516 /ORGANISM="Leptocylindrus danicus var. danicus, Strain B650" /LENGTH=62 /DNA_ID=CAMNT_0003531723 /DNA_START=72 /DNA_END=260 /DNA_ORIENTATION=+
MAENIVPDTENAPGSSDDAIDALTTGVMLSQNELKQNTDDLCDFNDFLEGVNFGESQANSYY